MPSTLTSTTVSTLLNQESTLRMAKSRSSSQDS
jgi:hypothetical protein